VIRKKLLVCSPYFQPDGFEDGLRIPSTSANGLENEIPDSAANNSSVLPLPEKLNVQTELLRKRAITFDTSPQSPKSRDAPNLQMPSTSNAYANNTTSSEPVFKDPFDNGRGESLAPLKRTKSEMLHPYLSFAPTLGRNSVLLHM
jgi:hypothetical protein